MSIEQWGILALVLLVPLLEGVARLQRARTSRPDGAAPSNRAMRPEAPRPSLPRPQPTHDDLIRAEDRSAGPRGTSLPEPHRRGRESLQRRGQESLRGQGVVQWLRPVRNLRRAMILTTILTPPYR